MKMPVKDFKIVPLLCPANYTFGCGACRYGSQLNVMNPSTSSKDKFFGDVECNYIDSFNNEFTVLKRGNNG